MNRAIYVAVVCRKVVYLFISHMTDGNDISCSRSEMKECGNLDQPANRTKMANPTRSVRVCYRHTHTYTHFVAMRLLRRQKCTIFSNFTTNPTRSCNVGPIAISRMSNLQVVFWRFVANLKIKNTFYRKTCVEKRGISNGHNNSTIIVSYNTLV